MHNGGKRWTKIVDFWHYFIIYRNLFQVATLRNSALSQQKPPSPITSPITVNRFTCLSLYRLGAAALARNKAGVTLRCITLQALFWSCEIATLSTRFSCTGNTAGRTKTSFVSLHWNCIAPVTCYERNEPFVILYGREMDSCSLRNFYFY